MLKTWLVNCDWVLAANIAADLAAWCRLPGLYDCDDLKDAEPDTLHSQRIWMFIHRHHESGRPLLPQAGVSRGLWSWSGR